MKRKVSKSLEQKGTSDTEYHRKVYLSTFIIQCSCRKRLARYASQLSCNYYKTYLHALQSISRELTELSSPFTQ